MPEYSAPTTPDLPPQVRQGLYAFVEAARSAFGTALRSAVLYGSGAEGRLRATSDVNVILVLRAFDRSQADQVREPLRVAEAAMRLSVMFLLEAEITAAVEAFAEKFADVLRRRHVLYGDDPFALLAVARQTAITRLRQVLLNQLLRLRALYVLRSRREEQLALVVADAAGPLRSSAASLLELEGHAAESPREALRRVASALPEPDWETVLARLSEARETRRLAPGVAGDTLFRLIELATHMRTRAGGLS
jgi:predicted nucleotidyltransferase